MRQGRANWICFLPECMIIACHGISIKSFVWIFFLFALISFVVTYVHVMIVLEMSGNDLQFGVNYDYLDVPSINLDRSKDWSLKNGKFRLGDDAREGKNMIATKIIESPLTEIHGWWMPNVKWTAEINCKTGLSHICRKVLSAKCEEEEVHSIYQFLPINPDVSVAALLFSATSSSPELRIDQDYDKESILYSAIAYLKYTDCTTDHIRLDFSAGSYSEERMIEEKIIPTEKLLHSITVVLACKGFHGFVKFHETTVTPIGNAVRDATTLSCIRGERSHYSNHTRGSKIEKLISVKPSAKGTLFEPTVSLVTQVNMDHIEHLHGMLSYWKQPISASIFIPGDGSPKEGQKEDWKRLYIQKKLSRMKFPPGSNIFAVYAQSLQQEFHQNFLRNLAFSSSSDDYVLLLDAGFLPCPGFLKGFQETVFHYEDTGKDLSKVAFVVPVFQMVKELPLPNSKDELKALVTGEEPGAISFNRLTDPDAHRSTDYRHWFRAKGPYPVEVFNDKYEPYVVIKKTAATPQFDERFHDGPLDRISHIMELLAAGYEFIVLPHAWAITESSFPTASSESQANGFFSQTDVYVRRFEFISELMQNYRLGPCEQTEDTMEEDSIDDAR